MTSKPIWLTIAIILIALNSAEATTIYPNATFHPENVNWWFNYSWTQESTSGGCNLTHCWFNLG